MILLLVNSAWGLVILLSFVALGRLITRAIPPADKPDIFLAAGWGMAGMTVLGGILNLLGIATASVMMALVLALIFVDLLYEGKRFLGRGEPGLSQTAAPVGEPARRRDWTCIVLLVLFATFKYVTSYGKDFMPLDDRAGYLVQLNRMLQTGSDGLEPFSEHRLLSMSGQTFLLGLFTSVSPLKYAYLFDPGLCWLMIGGLTWSMIRRDHRASIGESCLLTGLVLLVETDISQNLSGQMTGAVLFLTLIRTAYLGSRAGEDLDRGSLLLLGLTFVGLCALKTTFLSFGVLFLMSWYGLRMLHRPGFAVVRELSLIGLISLALLSPWMWQQYLSGGTLLYPYLGKGYSLAGSNFAPSQDISRSIAQKVKSVIHMMMIGEVAPAVIALLLLTRNPFEGDRARWRTSWASLCAAVVGSLTLAYIFGPEHGSRRYPQPFLYAALIPIGLAGYFRARATRKGLVLAICLAIFVGNQWDDAFGRLIRLRRSVSGQWGLVVTDRQQIRDAQATIPAGSRILASLKDAFLLDYSRNPIWHFSHPGMVSPPPGMPLPAERSAVNDFLQRKTTDLPSPAPCDQLLGYLRQVGVDFLLFQRGVPPDYWWPRREIDEDLYWGRLVETMAILNHKQLLELREKCPVLYDDGDVIALDLRAPGESKSSGNR